MRHMLKRHLTKFSVRDLRRQPVGQLVLVRAAGNVNLGQNGSGRQLDIRWSPPEKWRVPVSASPA